MDTHSKGLKQLIEDGTTLQWSKHLDDREVQRHIGSRHSTDAFMNGECIWFSVVNDPIHGPSNKWVWFGYAKVGKATYRPIHLVLVQPVSDTVQEVTVMTAYDPSDRPWMWDDTFETRICWEKNLL